MSMQFPRGIDLSQAYATGEHWKTAPKMLAKPVIMTTNPTMQVVMVKARLIVVKTRMYSSRMAHLEKAMESP